MDFSLTDNEKHILLETARESILSSLEKRNGHYSQPDGIIMTSLGAFVTLHINGALRGCIGHILPVRPLFEDIKILARESAFRDPRFRPLSVGELGLADIELSVLSPLRIAGPENIEIGVHGILVRRGYNSGVFLPQVPVEQGWNREEYLHHVCLKAGIPGDSWRDEGTTLELFTALVFGEKDFS